MMAWKLYRRYSHQVWAIILGSAIVSCFLLLVNKSPEKSSVRLSKDGTHLNHNLAPPGNVHMDPPLGKTLVDSDGVDIVFHGLDEGDMSPRINQSYWDKDLRLEAQGDLDLKLDQNAIPVPSPTLTHQPCLVSPVFQSLDGAQGLHSFRNCGRVFYNRAPKCGSRTVLSTFKLLAPKVKFEVISKEKPNNKYPFYDTAQKLEAFVEDFSKYKAPFLYAQHLHFVNFTSYGALSPMFINVIRDPVEGLVSHYYFNAYGSNSAPLSTPGPKYNMTLDACVALRKGVCMNIHYIIPFFCGHDKPCRSSTAHSLAKAKRAVRDSYLAVGLTEDLSAFMEVMEALMPQFFTGASRLFAKQEMALHEHYRTVKKHEISAETKMVLKKHLHYEYDFYNFVKSRFYTLLSKVRSLKSRDNVDIKRRKKRNSSRSISPYMPVHDDYIKQHL